MDSVTEDNVSSKLIIREQFEGRNRQVPADY